MNAPPPYRLRPLQVQGVPGDIEIPSEGLTIGRDPTNGLVLGGSEHPYVSSHHARLERDGADLVLYDLGSKNGTTVNGEPVSRRRLRPGDRIQLGREVGASFLVLASDAGAQTVEIPPATALAPAAAPPEELGQSTIIRLKRALGRIEAHADGGSSRRSRPSWITLTLFFIVIGGTTTAVITLFQRQVEQEKQLEEQSEEIARQLDRNQEEVLAETNERWLAREKTYLAEKKAIEARFEKAQQALAKATAEQASQRELADLRQHLEDLATRVDSYEPIDLEAEALRQREILTGVLSAVVYIENRAVLKEVDGERYYHLNEVDGTRLRPKSEGSELYTDSIESGSGFCVTSDGYIITNAHVVKKQTSDQPLKYRGTDLEYALSLDVVFSGTAERHPARLISILEADDADFAVLRIEPFEGMPVIADFTVDRPIPESGTELRLFGFPLGKRLPQNDDVMEASVFIGSVSRRVQGYFQVQSAVYPGNSGGPVVDQDGRVVGVVTAVQTVDGGQIASDIGYILPIGRMASLWPPREPESPPPKRDAPPAPDAKPEANDEKPTPSSEADS